MHLVSYEILYRCRTIGIMSSVIELKKLPLDYSAVTESVESLDDPECCIHDHSTVPSDNHIMNQKLNYNTKRTIVEKPGCSKQKDIPEESSLQRTTENQRNQGLTIYLPREKVRCRVTSAGNLLYDLYAPQSYLIHSSRCTSYLRIEEISVSGQGHIPFRHKFDTRIKRIKIKAFFRGTKLHLPIPCDFKGTINAGKYLGSLKFIPSKTSIVHLYQNTNPNTRSPKTIRSYNSKINEIKKPIDSVVSQTQYSL